MGIEGLPDVYEQPFHRVDLAASRSLGRGLRLKVGATNIFNRAVVLKQGDITVQRYSPGFTTSKAATPPSDGFFDTAATFVGAIGSQDWTAGWAAYPVN
ncbi:MAG: hypothetical protein V2A73_04845 [Pseudomonadota bacterium]